MENRPDYYVVLGVQPSATLNEIRTAYRHRVQVLHPDRFDRRANPTAWAHANAMLLDLNEAFTVLSDPARRHAYDRAHTKSSKDAARPQEQQPDRTRSSAKTPHTPPRPTQPDPSYRFVARVLGAVVIVFGLLAWAATLEPQHAGLRERERRPVRSTNDIDPLSGYTPDRRSQLDGDADTCETGREPTGLPANGRVWRAGNGTPVAPLEIRLRGTGHYLVKLERNGSPNTWIFVRSGSTAEVLVPLGPYTLKYATGNGTTWCGFRANYPFGKETSFHRAEEIFTFTDAGTHYSGYTVELFLQSDGNLRTSRLGPDEW